MTMPMIVRMKMVSGSAVLRCSSRLYVAIGAPCNVCDRDDEGFGTIIRMNADGGIQVGMPFRQSQYRWEFFHGDARHQGGNHAVGCHGR